MAYKNKTLNLTLYKSLLHETNGELYFIAGRISLQYSVLVNAKKQN